MMTKKDRISEALGTKTGVPLPTVSDEGKAMSETRSKELATTADALREKMDKNKAEDYNLARENTRKLISEGMAIVPEMFEMVRESENPKMYDSAAGFMRVMLDLNKGLMGLSEGSEPKSNRKTPNASTGNEKPAEPQVQQTNVYITTESMLDKVTAKKGSNPPIDGDFKEVEED